MYPKIDRPCPYADRLAEAIDGDWCRMCKRTVVDLDAMDATERRVFLRGCEREEACVTYRLRPALAAAALAASMAALPAAAQQAPAAQEATADEQDIVVTGGIGPRYSVTVDTPVMVLPATDLLKSTRAEREARLRKARTRRGE